MSSFRSQNFWTFTCIRTFKLAMDIEISKIYYTFFKYCLSGFLRRLFMNNINQEDRFHDVSFSLKNFIFTVKNVHIQPLSRFYKIK